MYKDKYKFVMQHHFLRFFCIFSFLFLALNSKIWTQKALNSHYVRIFDGPTFHWLSTKAPFKYSPSVRFGNDLGLLYEYPLLRFLYVQSGLFYRYNNDGLKVKEGYKVQYQLADNAIVRDNPQAQTVELLQRRMHSQYLGWPMGLRFKSKDWGVWNIFAELGLQHIFTLAAKAEDKVRLNPTGDPGTAFFVHQLDVLDFWNSYDLEWYIQAGMSFNLIKRLDIFTSVGYAGGFLSVYDQGKFQIEPQTDPDLWVRGFSVRLGLSYRLGGAKEK